MRHSFCLECWKLMEATELGIVTLAFGVNILVALVSIRYPRPPFPPLRTPSKPAADVTPVRRPIKGLGTSPVRCILHGQNVTTYPHSCSRYPDVPESHSLARVMHPHLCQHRHACSAIASHPRQGHPSTSRACRPFRHLHLTTTRR